MKNDTKTTITIEMNNVDHAVKLTEALRKFFKIAAAGGDTGLCWTDGYDNEYTPCGIVGHDVRQPIISIEFAD